MEGQADRNFHASTPKRKMKHYMILKSTERIKISMPFPSRTKLMSEKIPIILNISYVSGGDD